MAETITMLQSYFLPIEKLKKKKKLKIELPYDPEIPLLGIYLEKT